MAAPGPLTRALLIPPNSSATPYTSWKTDVPGALVWPTVLQAHEEPASRARLGIPSEDVIISFVMMDPLGWDSYIFSLMGTVLTTPTAVTMPRFYLQVQTDQQRPAETLLLMAWSRTVWCPDTPVWLEARWHPTEGETLALKGSPPDMKKAAIDKAHKAIGLLKTLEVLGGRPPAMDEQSFTKNYLDTYRKLLDTALRDGNRRPTKLEVAVAMLTSSKSLTRYLRRYHLPWPPFP